MDISKILAHIQNQMEEISIEDERQSAPHGSGGQGYGGPSWENMHRLEMYSNLESLFEQIEKKEMSIKEEVLLDFFQWFLHQYDVENNNFSNNMIVQNNKIYNRFSIMEIE